MNSKPWLADGFFASVLPLLLCCGGIVVAWQWAVVGTSDRPWVRYVLPIPPVEAVNISHVEAHSSLDNLTGDIIYIQGRDNAFYFNTLYEGKWHPVNQAGFTQEFTGEECAPEWPGAESNAPIWKAPPVQKAVRDSAGFRFEHPMSIFVRCYVLYEDGSLEAWSRSDDATGLYLFFRFYGPALGICGGLLGSGLGAVIVRIRHRRRKNTAAPPVQEEGTA